MDGGIALFQAPHASARGSVSFGGNQGESGFHGSDGLSYGEGLTEVSFTAADPKTEEIPR